jgi:GTP diphosphokinase / guanosine-3',5'-bis(diphosphate) 3'-diphosphatase
MATLERAIEIAVKAHKDQKDKSGQPYILHPLRVMQKGTTDA